MSKNKKILIGSQLISVNLSERENDYISLTDIAKFKDKERTDYIIQNWMRNRDTIEFLGIWEKINNVNFKPIEFDGLRSGERTINKIKFECDFTNEVVTR